MKRVLLVFIKNPELGKVKTRLAKSIGDLGALQVYKKLLLKTVNVAEKSDARKQIWYSSYIDQNDEITTDTFEKHLQSGADLGERMGNAFHKAFDEGADRVVIIGSDCPGISMEILNDAFEKLVINDLIIGPSEDGGYYLLGMNQFHESLFRDVEWSTESVLESTLQKTATMGLKVSLLPELNDIDTIEDLRKSNLMK